MNDKNICPECGNIKKPCSERCIPCANNRVRIKNKEIAEKLRLKRLNNKKEVEKRLCKKCNKLFSPNVHNQKYCQKSCYKELDFQTSFINKKERGKNHLDYNEISYRQTFKSKAKEIMDNKYKVFRG